MIPKQLQNMEFRFNLLKPRDKIPFEPEWQKKAYAFDDKKLQDHIAGGGNYGIIGGYGRLRLLDIDRPEFITDIENVFKTFSVKTGKGGRHFYFLSDYDKNHVLPNGMGELRANMQFVVGPGSIHPNGNSYEVINDFPLTEINEGELLQILEPIFKTNPLQKTDYGKMLKGEALPGERNDGYFRTACFMRFQKIPIEVTLETLSAANNSNKKPISREELERLIKNAYNYSGTIKNDKENKINLPIDNYMDNAQKLFDIIPYFYDKSGMFMVWNDELCKYEEWSDVKIMDYFDTVLGFKGQTVSSTIKNNTLEAMKRIGQRKIPNDAPSKWIQFKDKAYSIESDNVYNVTPDFFFCNPIPWELGECGETPTLDNLFKQWVGEKYVPTLYELIAYCCYTDYPIQLLFCLMGPGRNGKGCFLKIVDKFIGKDNVVSTSLDLLTGNNKSRFESSKLYKKLVALVGETSFGLLNNTCLIKQLTGGDKIGYEKKGKNPFDDYNYAKIIIASNSLPTTQDTSDGFFRRWFIIDFPNSFPEGKDITKSIPDVEFNNLAFKVCKILKVLIQNGKFTNQGDIEERKDKYIFASNPLQIFINNCCIINDKDYCLANELYTAYLHYLRYHKKRRVKNPEFKAALEDEGYWIEKTSKKIFNKDGDYEYISSRWVDGLKLKTDWKVCANCASYASFSTPPYTRINEVGNKAQTSQSAQNEEPLEDKPAHIRVYEIIEQLQDKDGKAIAIELIQEAVKPLNLSEKELDDILKRLLEKGDIHSPRSGYYSIV